MFRLFCLVVVAACVAKNSVAQDEPTTVYLERKPLVIQMPDRFQVPIALEPKTEVTLTATASGPVQTVLCKLGDSVTSQAELVRLDSEEHRLLVERAKAVLDAANAANNEAEMKIADLDLKLAQLRLARTKAVAPFNATVVGVHVVTGQYVREAMPLVTLVDDSSVRALIPVERANTKVGETVPVTVEGQPYDATVTAILPLTLRFEPLRDLFASVASAAVEFPNSTGDLSVGQTVRSELIPRDPVAEVPNGAVSTDEAGNRRVFVIRDDMARSVTVQVLSAVGETDTFVAGEFAAGDELVIAGADQLVDGRRVVPAASAAAANAGAGRSNTTPNGRYIPREPEEAQNGNPKIGGF